MQDQLQDVQQIQASIGALAAMQATVCDPSPKQASTPNSKPRNPKPSIRGAFAAILGDGSVVAWGDPEDGGDNSAVREKLKDVQHIQASSRAFAAVLGDGSVITWGHPDHGGDNRCVQDGWA